RSAPRRSAVAISVVLAWCRSPIASANPIRKWASIMPELPRAPRTAARAAVLAVSGSDASPSARSASATARKGRRKLGPGSPSGTGKTLIRLISSRPAATQSAAANSARANRGPSRYVMPAIISVGLLRDDGDSDLGMDLMGQADADRVLAQRLDRVLELDPAPVLLVTLLGECVGRVLGGDRAEQLALVPRLAGERDRDARQRRGELLGLRPLGLLPCGAGPAFGRDPLLVAFGGFVG